MLPKITSPKAKAGRKKGHLFFNNRLIDFRQIIERIHTQYYLSYIVVSLVVIVIIFLRYFSCSLDRCDVDYALNYRIQSSSIDNRDGKHVHTVLLRSPPFQSKDTSISCIFPLSRLSESLSEGLKIVFGFKKIQSTDLIKGLSLATPAN